MYKFGLSPRGKKKERVKYKQALWRTFGSNRKEQEKNCKIIIILVITFMLGFYNYIPETSHVSREYSVAAVLHIQFVLHVMLFHP
jgi:hypothetical protein